MKRIAILLYITALIFGLMGCGSKAADTDPVENTQTETTRDSVQVSDSVIKAKVNCDVDFFELMGIEYQDFLSKITDDMVVEFLDGESAGTYEAAYHYILNNGAEASISSDGYVISVHTSYTGESIYPVPLVKGIGGEDDYTDAVAKLGKPYYEGPEKFGADEKEIYTAVFYAGHYRYLKVYFDNEEKLITSISCFYGEAPELDEYGGVGIGDSLEDLKAAFAELYYQTAYYSEDDAAAGIPKFNRIYYTPMEDRDRGVECVDFYLYEKKIVRITSSVSDSLVWENYGDIFGMAGVYKENNVIGHTGTIVYFYDDAEGNEQVLLTVENAATEEHDIDDDGITEIIAYYNVDNRPAVDLYDFDSNTQTILHLDVRRELGAEYAEYMENNANVKDEYRKCITAGFINPDGTPRTEVYSVKDNILTYVGPYTQDLFQ